MAILGDILTAPEVGWQRFDHTNAKILYVGTFSSGSVSGAYGGNVKYSDAIGSCIRFGFYGTKLRIINYQETSGVYWNNMKIEVDGVEYPCSVVVASDTTQVITFEKLDLPLDFHFVKIYAGSTRVGLDAIDIDDIGYLSHPFLKAKTTLASMDIGDIIPCRYKTSSGNPGVFTELGTCVASEISPTASSATPDGLFNFVKVDKGLYIADRNIQHSISWNTLDSVGFVEGKPIVLSHGANVIPAMTGYTTPSGSASSSTEQGGFQAYKAFDRDISTYWCASTTTGFLRYFFPTAKCIKGYRISETSLASANVMPKTWTFEGSNDGSNWVVLDYQANQFFAESESKVYPCINNQTYFHYRINVTANGGGASAVAIGEMEMYEEATYGLIRSLSGGNAFLDLYPLIPEMTGTTTPVGYGEVIYSRQQASYEAFRAFNRIYYSADTGYFYLNPFAVGDYLGYVFLNDVDIDAFSLKAVSTVASRMPKDFDLYYTLNGIDWVLLKKYKSVSAWADGASVYFPLDGTLKCRGLKIVVNALQADTILSIDEMQFYRKGKSLSLTDKYAGAYPSNNEWDEYITDNDLDGKITPGENGVWNWDTSLSSWCKETPIISLVVNTYRVARGTSSHKKSYTYSISTTAGATRGFRPVLEFPEPDSKQTNLFY